MSENSYTFSAIRAVIGLGNPGSKYSKTRHNIGFRFLDMLAERYAAEWNEKELMEYAQALISEEGGMIQRSVHLIKPTTFMNNSGRVLSFLLKNGIKPEEIVVVHDELEKPFGKSGVRWDGGARGHNGLRSVIGVIGKDFWRLWFGIGRPEDKSMVGNYVLMPFSNEEEVLIEKLLEDGVGFLEAGIDVLG